MTMNSWNEVVIDMLKRDAFGAEKYGRHLTPHSGEDMLQHAYEEAVDLAVYLKTRILEEASRQTTAQDPDHYHYYYES
jgi:hypothetical protein